MTQNELTAAATEIALANIYDPYTPLNTWLGRIRATQSRNPNEYEAAIICRRANRAYNYAEMKAKEARARVKREQCERHDAFMREGIR